MTWVGDSLFESVPNFSEGRDGETVAATAGAARAAHVLDVDADPDHNRAVISLAGLGPNLLEALVASVRVAIGRIDVRRHQGVHPRVGAADVLPIVPLGPTPLSLGRDLARELIDDFLWRSCRSSMMPVSAGASGWRKLSSKNLVSEDPLNL